VADFYAATPSGPMRAAPVADYCSAAYKGHCVAARLMSHNPLARDLDPRRNNQSAAPLVAAGRTGCSATGVPGRSST
jgi:hypothetical protein